MSSLLKKYAIPPESIGRLEVGTETLLDKSKSVKTVLMQLFAASGNTNIEGVDTVNACYGGTNALFNAVNWIESRSWDGRDAIVVAGDIAVYNKGPARPTGGAGIVAILVGPDAPIVLEPGRRGTYMQHAYDFYKPDPTSEYPVVDGKFSNKCYIRAVDACYAAYSKFQTNKQSNWDNNGHTNEHTNGHINGHTNGYINGYTNGYTNGYFNGETEGHENGENSNPSQTGEDVQPTSELNGFHFMCFHSPNCKLVAKSYARLLYNDYRTNPRHDIFRDVPPEIMEITYEDSLANGPIEKIFMKLSDAAFQKRVLPSTQVPRLCGNMYTASLYSSFASLLSNIPSAELQGKRIGLFSYGSGLASSMFSLKVVGDTTKMADAMDLDHRLKVRKVVTPVQYEEVRAFRLTRQSSPPLRAADVFLE